MASKPNISMFIGHNLQIKLIENLVSSDSLPHAFLFFGPRGVGKSTFAYAFAKWLNCEGIKIEFNDILNKRCKCENCSRDILTHPDIICTEGLLEIAEVRKIKKQVNFSPQRGKYKFVIISDVEKLQPPSANALLKILEEPSASTIFILITDNLSNVMDTIKSRCFTIKFFYAQDTVIEKNINTRTINDVKSHWKGRPALATKFLKDKNYYKLVLDTRNECDLFLNGTLYDRFKLSEKYAKIKNDREFCLDLPQKLVIWLEYINESRFNKSKGLNKISILRNLLNLHKLIINTNCNVQMLFNNFAVTFKL